eukprot:4799695-Prorocentrum_lima.AAC.1
MSWPPWPGLRDLSPRPSFSLFPLVANFSLKEVIASRRVEYSRLNSAPRFTNKGAEISSAG